MIRSRSIEPDNPTANRLANAWQIMYASTDSLGNPIYMTGTVLIPKQGDQSQMPIVAIGPGTSGPAFRCAPSRFIDKGAFYEQASINDALKAGYAVVVTDYEGYKPDPEVTYIVGRSTGAAILNGVRAAINLPESSLSSSAKTVVRGYSQGGGAAMWAGQMQPTYAPELNLVGVVGGGVPANLANVALQLNGSAGFGVLFQSLQGFSREYPEYDFDSFLNDRGREIQAEFQDDVCILKLLQDYEGVTLTDVSDVNPLNATVLARIEENKLGGVPIQVPVYQYHDVADGLVKFDQAEALKDQYCDRGVNLQWNPVDTNGATGIIRHINLVYRGNAEVNKFIADRFAGRPATPNCSN